VNIIRVTASSELLRELRGVDGMEFGGGLIEEGGGVWTTSAYATDEAISAARDRGAHVDVLLDAQTRLAQLRRVAARARASIEARASMPPGTET
jgi:hypothetical protein